jgi:uncharacterized repeat protein (TIGR03987 family)
MMALLPLAIVSMIAALSLYTIGVWGEKITGMLKDWHLGFFWIGFMFDTLGTTVMGRIAGVFQFNVHGITGVAAIALMLAHAIWATIVLRLKQEEVLRSFHRYSLAVWGIWLVPFVSGLVLAMMR